MNLYLYLSIADGLNECSLYCMASGYRMFAQLADKVDDGTICGKHGHSACYNGTCSRKRPKVSIIMTGIYLVFCVYLSSLIVAPAF